MRFISNEEFAEALTDRNKKIFYSAVRNTKLSLDERYSCYLISLWSALSSYDSAMNVKFTTYFYYVSKWNSLDFEKQVKKKLEDRRIRNKKLELDLVELLDPLSEVESKILTDRFLGNKTLEEISSELKVSKNTVRNKLEKIKKKLTSD